LTGACRRNTDAFGCFFQLSNNLVSGFQTLHPFIQIMQECFDCVSENALTKLVSRLNRIRKQYFPESKFIIAVDEAQQAARLYPHAFISSTNINVSRSILREIVRVFTELPVKLVLSGTGLSLGEVQSAVASGVSK
jgi:hypothetical protein